VTGAGARTRTVLWDIGGVIVDLASIRAGYAAFVDGLAADHGFDPDDALERWKTTLGDHFRGRDGNRYRLAREGYAKATAELFDGDPPAGWESRLEAALGDALEPEAGAVGTIRALSSSSLGLAIVSDVDTPEARLMLDTLGVRDCFDHVTTSEAIGYTKPDERMFRDALEATDADPARTVMIGDRYDHDIVGAAALGIGTIGYGSDAHGPETDHEIDDLRDVLGIVGVDE
jgi:putative hydrolase of the HAD superfamily